MNTYIKTVATYVVGAAATYLVGAAPSYLVQAENKANSAPLERGLWLSLAITHSTIFLANYLEPGQMNAKIRCNSLKWFNQANYYEVTTQLYCGSFVVVVVVNIVVVIFIVFVAAHIWFSYGQ